MDAPLRLRFGHALHAVHAALELEPRIRAVAVDREADLLEAAELRLVEVDDLGLPAALFGVHRVHAVEVVRKQRRLLAARAAADLDDDAALVVRVARQKQNLELFRDARRVLARRIQLLRRHLAQLFVGLRVVEKLLRARSVRLGLFQRAVMLDDRRDLLVLLHQRRVLFPVRRDRGVVQFEVQLLIPVFKNRKIFKHSVFPF